MLLAVIDLALSQDSESQQVVQLKLEVFREQEDSKLFGFLLIYSIHFL